MNISTTSALKARFTSVNLSDVINNCQIESHFQRFGTRRIEVLGRCPQAERDVAPSVLNMNCRRMHSFESCPSLRRDLQRPYRGNPLHNFVPPKIIDDRVACLHGVQNTIRLRPVEQRSQFHEMMAAASRVETVGRD